MNKKVYDALGRLIAKVVYAGLATAPARIEGRHGRGRNAN
jgi:hypothetical protein